MKFLPYRPNNFLYYITFSIFVQSLTSMYYHPKNEILNSASPVLSPFSLQLQSNHMIWHGVSKVLYHFSPFYGFSEFILKMLSGSATFWSLFQKCYLILRLFRFSSKNVIWICDFMDFPSKVLSHSADFQDFTSHFH